MTRPVIVDVYRRNDIIAVTEPHFFGNAIGRCQRRCPERYTREEAAAWHVGIIEQWPIVYESIVLKGVTETDYSRPGAHTGFMVFRPYDWPLIEYKNGDPVDHMRMKELRGAPYDMLGIIGMYVLSVFYWQTLDDKLDSLTGWYCSEAVFDSYEQSGYKLPTEIPPRRAWPAEIVRLWIHGLLYRVVPA